MPSMPQKSDRGETTRPCRRYDLNLFFPRTESSRAALPNDDEKAALRVCAICPLAQRRRCLDYALTFPTGEQYGVVGGATAAQRRAIIRGRRAELLAGVA